MLSVQLTTWTGQSLMPGFHHSVAVSPFCRCKIPLFCKNYVRKFRSVTAVNGKKICSGKGNGNGVRKRQRLTVTAKRQRKNGNAMVETGHKQRYNIKRQSFGHCTHSCRDLVWKSSGTDLSEPSHLRHGCRKTIRHRLAADRLQVLAASCADLRNDL